MNSTIITSVAGLAETVIPLLSGHPAPDITLIIQQLIIHTD